MKIPVKLLAEIIKSLPHPNGYVEADKQVKYHYMYDAGEKTKALSEEIISGAIPVKLEKLRFDLLEDGWTGKREWFFTEHTK